MQDFLSPDNIKDFSERFSGTLYQALPFIVLGAVIAGLLEELVPQRFIARLLPRSRVLAICLGGLLGLVFPMCECGIIPVMRRLLRKGLPLSCCVCYMLAGPIINVVVMLSTYVAFTNMETTSGTAPGTRQFGSVGMTVLRVTFGYVVAVGASLVVERQYRKYGSKLLTPFALGAGAGAADDGAGAPRPPLLQRISNITETALHDFVDITVFLILGALIAAVSRLVVSNADVEAWARHYPPLIFGMATILTMMAFAVLLCLCSEADAFVAASFSTLPAASKLAFLVLGPMLDFKLYLMYTRVFRPRLIWTIILAVVVLTFVLTNLFHLALQFFPGLFPLDAPTKA